MRKMNKIVALSLVLAMALSMMASAAFKDQATINADLTADISLLVALNVFSEQGTGAGYFEPNVELTRAQVAKLVYVLKNKGNDNGATSWTGMNIFKDVETNSWYEGYVNYCASVGMIAGTGDGMFNPNGTLTGVELAKMLLVVIGYKADLEGYTGAKWDANILADAEAAGFFVDYELPVRGVVTREWAAQMIVNALNATKVRYEDGEAVEMYNNNNEAITYMAQDLGLDSSLTGVLVATPNMKLVESGSAANNTNGKNKVSAIDTNKNGYYDDKDQIIEFAAAESLLGQDVKVTVNVNKGKVYGVTANDKVTVLDTTIDAVSYDADDFNNALVTYEDGVMGEIAKEAKNDKKETINPIKTFFGNNDGREIKLIDNNDDGKWDTAVFASVAYDKVGYINAANHTLRMNTFSIDGSTATAREEAWEKVNFVDSIAKNDIVKVTKDFSTGKEITVIELVDVVAGTLTKLTSGGVATIDGSTYEKSTKVVADFTLEVKSTAKNYFVDGKYVVYSDNISSTEEVPSNLALLVNAGQTTKTDSFGNDVYETVEGQQVAKKTDKVEVVLNDGTKAVYTYDKSITSDALEFSTFYKNNSFDKNVEHTIYEYVMKDSKIALKALGTDAVDAAAKAEFVKKDAVVKNGATYRTNEDTYFFVIDGTKYSVAKASELKTNAAITSKNVVVMKDGFNYAVAAAVTATISGDDKVYLTATSYNEEYSEADEKNVFYFDVTDLENNVVTLKLENAPADTLKNVFVKYTVDENGFATLKGHNDSATAGLWWKDMGYNNKGAVTFFDETAALINGVEYEFASDMEIYYVDAYVSSSKARLAISEGDGLVLAAEKDNNTYEENVRFALEDGKISKIIVEVNGEFIWNADKLYGTDVTESYYVAE